MSTKLDYFKNPNLLIDKIKKITDRFRENIESMYIIGSLARNEFMIDSDVDLLLVSNNNQIIDSIRNILDEILIDNGIAYDLIVMTELEFDKRKNTPLIKEALLEGIEL